MQLKSKLDECFKEGECVGIGALNYKDRKFFSLINERELNKR